MSEKNPTYFDDENGMICLCTIIIYGIVAVVTYFLSLPYLDLLGIIVYITIASIIFVLFWLCIWWDSSKYCETCKKRIHPIFNFHHCEIDTKDNNLKLNALISKNVKHHDKDIQQIINDLSNLQIFNNDGEKEIFRANMVSLKKLEMIKDYKYVMIAIGSILEFLLKKYCKLNNISPESYTDPLGNTVPANKKYFVSYVQSAIVNNLFGQEKSWHMVQNSLRNFRNYVHINREIKEEKIDEGWYKSINYGFKRILSNFK